MKVCYPQKLQFLVIHEILFPQKYVALWYSKDFIIISITCIHWETRIPWSIGFACSTTLTTLFCLQHKILKYDLCSETFLELTNNE